MRGMIGALVAAAAVAAMAGSASAAVVCNSDGDCWRVKQRYNYKPELGLRIYGDNWRWKPAEKRKFRWREARQERGYYRGGVWITF